MNLLIQYMQNQYVVLVIKKNKTILENLIDWLAHNENIKTVEGRKKLMNVPALIIDDEIAGNNIVEIELSLQNYQRLTVPPGLWVGFQNLYKKQSLILNIADMEHDPAEKDTKSLDEIDYKWSNA